VEIKAESGWLTDRDVKHPKHEAAAYADYKGDKSQAFWHFDKEMALAVNQYHKDVIRSGQGRTLFRPAGLFDELWPLGEKMDIPFKGDTPAEYATAVRQWIDKKTGNRLDKVVVRYLAEGIAGGLKKDKEGKAVDEGVCRLMCQHVCYSYDDAYRPVAEAIEKASLPAESKSFLRAYHAELLLTLLPNGRAFPELSVRGMEAWIAALPATVTPEAIEGMLQNATALKTFMRTSYGIPAGPRPDNLDKLIENLRNKDGKAGWAAVDELAKIGQPAILDMVRIMDFGQPFHGRATGALRRMGKVAECTLPDLRRASLRSGISEMESAISVEALQAIEQLEKQGDQR
jgi:hypothetical protein